MFLKGLDRVIEILSPIDDFIQQKRLPKLNYPQEVKVNHDISRDEAMSALNKVATMFHSYRGSCVGFGLSNYCDEYEAENLIVTGVILVSFFRIPLDSSVKSLNEFMASNLECEGVPIRYEYLPPAYPYSGSAN